MIENNDLLKEGDVCDVVIHEENNLILACELPNFVVLEVTSAESRVSRATLRLTYRRTVW
jgi:hypothetical protein